MLHFIGILLQAGIPIGLTGFVLVWWALRRNYLGGASTLKEYEQWQKAADQARKAQKRESKARRKAERRNQSATARSTNDPAASAELQTAELATESLGEDLHPGKRKHDFLHSKWMEFGGGFYGVVAVFTYGFIEVAEVRDFLVNVFHLFDQGLVSLVVKFIVQSIMNFITAIAWPVYWLSRIHSEQWLWAIGAYGGYWLGAHAAFRYGQHRAGP